MVPWLDPNKPPIFPDTCEALEQPNGLLAAGGKLSIDWLLVAYRQGIFPWFSQNEPILWWSPAPRTVLTPALFHTSKSLEKLSRQQKYHITQDEDFEMVIRQCAMPRQQQADTWITDEMIEAYIAMFKAGFAHSYECRDTDNLLVGGVYGISLSRVFFGESMFSRTSNASKLCLKHIIESAKYDLIDCQMATEHLMSLGAVEIGRAEFEGYLDRLTGGLGMRS
ncbi:MAG: leucyl/phenylalanyl-tRNA--protein transferase [Gammaproteobacteria bacterium]|nr:leucyl/phenylalanyl-tRNA--protein transferase [Gammaproteobacteria bacterium]